MAEGTAHQVEENIDLCAGEIKKISIFISMRRNIWIFRIHVKQKSTLPDQWNSNGYNFIRIPDDLVMGLES